MKYGKYDYIPGGHKEEKSSTPRGYDYWPSEGKKEIKEEVKPDLDEERKKLEVEKAQFKKQKENLAKLEEFKDFKPKRAVKRRVRKKANESSGDGKEC